MTAPRTARPYRPAWHEPRHGTRAALQCALVAAFTGAGLYACATRASGDGVALQVPPGAPGANCMDGAVGNGEQLRDSTVGQPRGYPLPYGQDVVGRELADATPQPTRTPPLSDHIGHVFFGCAEKQVARVAATSVVAVVADEESVRNVPVSNHPCDSMGAGGLTSPVGGTVELTVAGDAKAQYPRPASIGAAGLIDACPKASGVSAAHVGAMDHFPAAMDVSKESKSAVVPMAHTKLLGGADASVYGASSGRIVLHREPPTLGAAGRDVSASPAIAMDSHALDYSVVPLSIPVRTVSGAIICRGALMDTGVYLSKHCDVHAPLYIDQYRPPFSIDDRRDLMHLGCCADPSIDLRPAVVGERLRWRSDFGAGELRVTSAVGGIVSFAHVSGTRLYWGCSGTGLYGDDGALVAVLSQLYHDGGPHRIGNPTGGGEGVQVP